MLRHFVAEKCKKMSKSSLTFFGGYATIQTDKEKEPEEVTTKMMYSEFIQGTGCKANEHNFKVFQNLEIMYMNSNMTKAEIYEYGKKLVDNSKTEQELQIERKVKAEIETLKNEIEWNKNEISRYKFYLPIAIDKTEEREYISRIQFLKNKNHEYRGTIRSLEWVLE